MNYDKLWGSNDLELLSELSIIRKGTAITESRTASGSIPVIAGGKEPAYYHNTSNRNANVITVSASGANSGFVNYFDQAIFASDCNTINSKNEKTISTKLIYLYLKTIQSHIYELQRGQAQPHVYGEDLAKIKIPLPTKDIQNKIVSEIEVLEEKERKAKEKIEDLETYIDSIFNNSDNNILIKFSEVAILEYGKALHRNQRINGEYSVMGSNGKVGIHNKYLIKGPSIIVGRKGSAGKINFVEEDCFPIDTTFWVKYDNSKTHIKYFYYLLKKMDLENIAKGKGIGVPGLNRNNVHNIKIPLPTLKEQKQIVTKIEKIEKKINKLEKEIKAIPQEKENILKKHLT